MDRRAQERPVQPWRSSTQWLGMGPLACVPYSASKVMYWREAMSRLATREQSPTAHIRLFLLRSHQANWWLSPSPYKQPGGRCLPPSLPLRSTTILKCYCFWTKAQGHYENKYFSPSCLCFSQDVSIFYEFYIIALQVWLLLSNNRSLNGLFIPG